MLSPVTTLSASHPAQRAIAVAISSFGGKVTLSGVIGQGGDLAGAVDKIRQIDGVKDVENNVHRAPIGSGI
jgi:osmotically-inducible protein OsmY